MSVGKKLLIGIFTNHDDDIYCFRLELIQALLDEGYQLLVSCPNGPKFDLMDQKYGLRKERDFLYDDPPIDRRGTSIIQDGKLFFHYLHLLRKTKPSVILTYTSKPNVYACFAAKLLHIPVISNVTGLGSVLQMKGIKQELIMALFRKAFRSADHVMFQNEENMKLALEQGFVKGSYQLITGSGVALDRFPLQEYPDGGNGIEGPTVVFNYIGRILHDKGVDDYLEAAPKIKEKYPNTEFNLIGFIEPTEGHYKAKLDELERRGIIKYRGQQDDVLPWIRRSHAVIHPSIYGEGMSNVLLENAACGKPIITTDNPGCKETVSDGVSGFLYYGSDVDALVRTIEKFLCMPNLERKRMGEEGRKKMVQEFDRKIVVQAYLETIQRLYHQPIREGQHQK